MNDPFDANNVIEREIRKFANYIEKQLSGDLITFWGPIDDWSMEMLKQAIESLKNKKSRLLLNIETYGGYIESVERVVNILRHHYEIVDFIILNYAMSAGTVLVMSGDQIYMDYSATLGPIDPQVSKETGHGMVPALGYLEMFDRFVKKSRDNTITDVEVAYFLSSFDPAELYKFEQARNLSIALLKKWLVEYKFKNWNKTETRLIDVDEKMKIERAEEIAKLLNDTSTWHSHGRGISLKVITEDLKLQIVNLESEQTLRKNLVGYMQLLSDYRNKRGHQIFMIDWNGGYHGI